ncbi:hypothetical protein FA95DRAFT_1558198 [Auriscalpium vulgare]|uniref:Uncharacterized protein n=1 Tax=Auriscalpium vulgare TaxID=40419 RepID=A0ACB8RWV6_9AGAM|nr:hypothetical protein FA95DRAFT_1558198 [Auriscalpium vulgare]
MSPPDIRMPTTQTALRPPVSCTMLTMLRVTSHPCTSTSPPLPHRFLAVILPLTINLRLIPTQRAGGPANSSSLSREG